MRTRRWGSVPSHRAAAAAAASGTVSVSAAVSAAFDVASGSAAFDAASGSAAFDAASGSAAFDAASGSAAFDVRLRSLRCRLRLRSLRCRLRLRSLRCRLRLHGGEGRTALILHVARGLVRRRGCNLITRPVVLGERARVAFGARQCSRGPFGLIAVLRAGRAGIEAWDRRPVRRDRRRVVRLARRFERCSRDGAFGMGSGDAARHGGARIAGASLGGRNLTACPWIVRRAGGLRRSVHRSVGRCDGHTRWVAHYQRLRRPIAPSRGLRDRTSSAPSCG